MPIDKAKEMNPFIKTFESLGFIPLRGSATCWIYSAGDTWSIIAEAYPNGYADAFYSFAGGNEEDVISWDGTNPASFKQWFLDLIED